MSGEGKIYHYSIPVIHKTSCHVLCERLEGPLLEVHEHFETKVCR